MIYEQLKILTQNSDKKALSKALGYVREQNFTRALVNLEAAKSLDEFITKGHFDWAHSSETLILALSEYFALSIEAELSEVQKLYNERVKFRGSYIYIDTNFKRKNEPIFALAMAQHLRYISLTPFLDKLCFKALDEQLNIISKVVKDYYQKTKSLPIFGEITGFKLYFLGKNYSLDTDGNFIQKEIFESMATLKF
ncbi:MAG: hypothetical protein ACFN4I_05490 [Campylobacter concisus]